MTALFFLLQLADFANCQALEASLTIIPKLQQPRGLIVSGKANVPKGHLATVTVTDRFLGITVDTTTTKLVANGEYKTKIFCNNKRKGILTPGRYLAAVTIELGEQSFGNSLAKNPGPKTSDHLSGLNVWGEESGRYLTNVVTFTVGGEVDVKLQYDAALKLTEEYRSLQEEFKLLNERQNKSRVAVYNVRNPQLNRKAPSRKELEEFAEQTTEIYEQVVKRIAAIENAQVRQSLESQADKYSGHSKQAKKKKVVKKNAKQPILNPSEFASGIEWLMGRAEAETVNGGFFDLTSSDGKKRIRAKVFSNVKNGLVLQAQNGQTKFYTWDKFDRASQTKLNKPAFVDNILVVFVARHRKLIENMSAEKQ